MRGKKDDTRSGPAADNDLVARSRDGDEEAMGELLEKYKPLVIKYAGARFLPGGDRDDLIQEGMIGLYKAIMGYDASREASFSTFAALCVDRQILRAIEASGREKNRPLNQSLSIDETGADLSEMDHGESLENTVIERVTGSEILSAVRDDLSPFEMDVMELIMEGLSYREAAERLGRSPKSVDNAITRIRSKVRKSAD